MAEHEARKIRVQLRNGDNKGDSDGDTHGEVKEVLAGTRAEEVMGSITSDQPPVAAKIDGNVVDVYTPLQKDCTLEPVLAGSVEGLEVLRHTTAHVMAQAVSRLFSNVEFAIGPVIEDGFYYDFNLADSFTPDDFPKIEEEMRKIALEDLPVHRIEMSKEEAQELLRSQDAKFKSEVVRDSGDTVISFYRQGEYTDLCRGPHLPRTGMLRSFRLLKIAGAYWRGDERREMLQRIYATAFFDQEQLDEYLALREEAKKRDHRKIGKELDLFSFQPEAPGMAFWHPKGAVLYQQVTDHLRSKLNSAGYEWVQTPMILNESLWRESGHWEHYRDNMFFTEIDDASFAVKPMNCPGATRVYRHRMRSYRDLPLRLAEFGLVHRNEKSGVFGGLFRVRAFVIDDAHIFCTPDQIQGEVSELIDLIFEVYRDFQFDHFRVELSTRPAKSIGSPEMWERAEGALRSALEFKNVDFDVSPGEGAFYGPKIDFHVRDALKRMWQCGTIQIDFSMPERFDLDYIGEDGDKHRPAMIHRAIYGSVERFLGILIEHHAGAFPTWLSPEQVRLIPVSEEKQKTYTEKVLSTLRDSSIRAVADRRPLKVGKQIREAQLDKVPYMLILGPKEEDAGTVSVRRRDGGDVGPMDLGKFRDELRKEIDSKSAQLEVGGDAVDRKGGS
ncbi:MAG: threonine--tRNA ligase [Planctomycetota bacterium]|nr:threonine--tRNA ligase [Planctomycetota bacterium]